MSRRRSGPAALSDTLPGYRHEREKLASASRRRSCVNHSSAPRQRHDRDNTAVRRHAICDTPPHGHRLAGHGRKAATTVQGPRGLQPGAALGGRQRVLGDRPLGEATQREGAGWVLSRRRARPLRRRRAAAGWSRLANENPPVLRTFDRYGHRIDEVEFHPAWHQLMRMGSRTAHSLPWRSSEPYAAHRARRAYMTACRPRPARLPDHDDLRRDARAARAAGARREWEPQLMSTQLRPAHRARRARRAGDLGHGDDREAGRLGRARQHDRAHAAERRRRRGRVRDRRPQVVLLGADVRLFLVLAQTTRASPASWCRGSCPTARATRSTSSA